MKSFFLFVLLLACSSPEKSEFDPERIKAEDAKIIENLHEEPMRMGTKKVQTEGIMKTEIWTYREEHGSPESIVETLLFKNGKLVSHSITDSATRHSYSRQYQNGKVIEATEVKGDRMRTYFFDENEKLRARWSDSECILYTGGENPRKVAVSQCERNFNTAP